MAESVNLIGQPENLRVSFYGALFAIAAVDGAIDREEVNLIFESIDLEGLSEKARRTIHGYLIEPPPIESCLSELENAPDEIRFGLMINLVEVVLADDYVDENEETLLETARNGLHISKEQFDEINDFVLEMRRIKERGLDDNVAADAMKRAASGLAGVGIPIAAVYFSGSVIGFSAAGITSGLAALGIGMGMVPGIGVAILVGTVVTIAVSKLLDVGGKRKKGEMDAARERKAQLVIKNLQEAINTMSLLQKSLRIFVSRDAKNRLKVVLDQKMLDYGEKRKRRGFLPDSRHTPPVRL